MWQGSHPNKGRKSKEPEACGEETKCYMAHELDGIKDTIVLLPTALDENKKCHQYCYSDADAEKNNKNVKMYLGDSKKILPTLLNNINEPVTIYLDAHYSGGETAFGDEEAEIVYDIAQRLEGRLLALGASVFLTRGPKNVLTENEIITFSNKNSADLVISLHTDKHSNPDAHGVSTYFYGSDAHGVHSIVGERFASLVQREICARTDLTNCRTHAKTWDLLRMTMAPTVRIDLGYTSNPGDLGRLSRPDFRDVIAEALVIAIQRLYLAAEDDAKTGTLRISDLRKAGIRR